MNRSATEKNHIWLEQVIPLSLTLAALLGLTGLLWLVITGLNLLPLGDKISPVLHWGDILIGATIYLKTSVDFAIFMGRLMAGNPGWKNRVAIELGTALGNALGTILILTVWIFFKEIHWLLGLMIFLAALVLFELAAGGLEHLSAWQNESPGKREAYRILGKFLGAILKIIRPLTSRVLPDLRGKLNGKSLPWKHLLWFALTVPFLLGLDDFAGYVPLFNLVNVFGFSVGVLAAHTALNIALFINPGKTAAAVRNAWISFFGTLAFIALAFWGLIEVGRIIFAG